MQCGGCERKLPDGVTECLICGWKESAAEKRKENKARFGCSIQQCPMPGSCSRSLKGGGPWFCRDHYSAIMEGASQKKISEITARLIAEDQERRNVPQKRLL